MAVLRRIQDRIDIQLQNQVIIGRDKISNFRIPHLSISRKHACIRFYNNNWIIVDLQSTNGLFINGNQVKPYLTMYLINGDIVSFGPLYNYQFITKNNFSAVNQNRIALEHNYSVISNNKRFKTQISNDRNEFKKEIFIIDKNLRIFENKLKKRNLKLINKTKKKIKEFKELQEKLNKSVQSFTLTDIINELKCKLCNNLIVSAVNINCSHSFCLHCIENYKKEQNNHCPICKVEIKTQNKQLVINSLIDRIYSEIMPEQFELRKKNFERQEIKLNQNQ